MKTFMLFTRRGALVILTSCESVTAPESLQALKAKGVEKFIAFEIPLGLAKARYGPHFFVAEHDLDETNDLRILDQDASRAFRLFRFSELGPLIVHESDTPVAAR